MLNASARICRFNLSLILALLKIEVSTSTKPGPRKEPRDTLPKVPGMGIEKACGLNHSFGFPKISLP